MDENQNVNTIIIYLIITFLNIVDGYNILFIY